MSKMSEQDMQAAVEATKKHLDESPALDHAKATRVESLAYLSAVIQDAQKRQSTIATEMRNDPNVE